MAPRRRCAVRQAWVVKDPAVGAMDGLPLGAWRTTSVSDSDPAVEYGVVAAWQGSVVDLRGREVRLGTVAHLRRRDATTTEIDITLLRWTEADEWVSLVESGVHVVSPNPLVDEIAPLRTAGGCGRNDDRAAGRVRGLEASTVPLEEIAVGFRGVFPPKGRARARLATVREIRGAEPFDGRCTRSHPRSSLRGSALVLGAVAVQRP